MERIKSPVSGRPAALSRDDRLHRAGDRLRCHDDRLHSGPEGSKLEMLEHNNNVCITFSVGHKLVYQHEKVACSYSMRSESAMCRGQVEFIEEIDEKRRALDIIMRHYTDSEFNYSDPAVRNVKVWQVRINQMTGKVFGLRANEKP